MLQSIRERTHGWIAGIVIFLVILSFGLWGIHTYVSGMGTSTIVAKVNGTDITRAQLASAFERARRQMQMSVDTNNLPEQVENELRTKTLDTLISVQVMKQASIDQHFRVSSTQIDGFLMSMPEFQVDGQFSLPKLQQYLSSSLISSAEFLDLIKSNLLIEQPRLGILFSSFALPDEVTSTVAMVNQERDIAYLTLPESQFMKAVSTVSQGEIDSYYRAHQAEFKTPEQVSVDYVALSLKGIEAGLTPSEDALKAYYNDNINTYTLPQQIDVGILTFPIVSNTAAADIAKTKQEAETIRSELLKGSLHNAKAVAFDKDTKARSWTTVPAMAADLQKGAMSLSKDNPVSEVIATPHGFVLLKLYDTKAPVVQAYAEVKSKVQEALIRQQAEEKLVELRDKLASISYEYPDSLQPTAKALGLPVQTSGLFTLDTAGKDIALNKKVREAAFSAEVLNSQNNSDVIQIDSETSLVLRVHDHIPAKALPLESVQKGIIDKITAQKAADKAEETAKGIVSSLQAGVSRDSIAAQYHVTWENSGYLGRYATKVNTAVVYTAFRLPQKSLYAYTKIPNGYAVVGLNGIRDGSLDNKSEEKDVFRDQVQNSEGLLEYRLYEQSLIKKAKIMTYLNAASDN